MGYSEPIRTGPDAGGYRAVYRDPFIPARHGRGNLQVRIKGETFASPGEAKARANREERRLRDVAAGLDTEVSTARDTSPTLLDYGVPALENMPKEWARSTRDKYIKALRRLVRDHFGEAFKLSKLDVHAVERCYMWLLRAGKSPQSRTEAMVTLRHVVDTQRRDARLGGYKELDDPGSWQVETKAPPRQPQRMASEDELASIAHFMEGWLTPALYLAHDAGLRVSEIAGLKESCVDLVNRELYAGRMVEFDGTERDYDKGRNSGSFPGAGWLPMSERLYRALEAHLAMHGGNGHDRVFVRPRDGEPITIMQLEYRLRKARTLAGIEGVTWHSFRRSFGTRLDNSGLDRKYIQILMRHKSEATTATYIQWFDQKKVAAHVRQTFCG